MHMGKIPIVNYWGGYHEDEHGVGPRTAGMLMEDGETAIFMDMDNVDTTIAKIREHNSPEEFKRMSDNLRKKWADVIGNWEEDIEAHKKWLENLV